MKVWVVTMWGNEPDPQLESVAIEGVATSIDEVTRMAMRGCINTLIAIVPVTPTDEAPALYATIRDTADRSRGAVYTFDIEPKFEFDLRWSINHQRTLIGSSPDLGKGYCTISYDHSELWVARSQSHAELHRGRLHECMAACERHNELELAKAKEKLADPLELLREMFGLKESISVACDSYYRSKPRLSRRQKDLFARIGAMLKAVENKETT